MPKKIKVVNVITDSNIGGAGSALLTFLRRYDRDEFDIDVILPENSALIPKLTEIGVPYAEVKHSAESSLRFKTIFIYRKLFKALQPDIVHTHASMSARIAARLFIRRCKIVYTRHSAFNTPDWQKTFPFKQILGFMNNFFSDAVIAVSPAVIENLPGVRESKITVIYNGAEAVQPVTEREKDEFLRGLGIAPGTFVCTMAARLVPEKGHDYVVEAAKIIRDSGGGAVFLFAGNGRCEEDLKKAVSGAGLDNVRFLGFVNDLKTVYGATDLLINASYGTEATSMTLLEGMSAGVPAVASDFGGNPYIIENGVNGLIVPQKDAQALARAIKILMNNRSECKKMSANAREMYKSSFTPEKMTRNVENVYIGIGLNSKGLNK